MEQDTNANPTEDFDPGAPAEATESPAFGKDVEHANMGEDGAGDLPEGELEAPVENFGHPGNLAVDIVAAQKFLNACMASNPRVRYGLGAKVTPPGATPGTGFTKVDCSGFVREALRRATTLGSKFPDGSVIQHDWIRARDFEKVAPKDGALKDGAVRIAFLKPQDSPQRIGHVVLLHSGVTLESHGGVGPDRRPWDMKGWQTKSHVYVLTRP
jgi:cell wall-associated NlpC family hydrolase